MIQNPHRILRKYIHPGMTVLDLGCGPGFFTLEMAQLLKDEGKVFALDVQQGMLDILNEKLNQNPNMRKMVHVRCNTEKSLEIFEKVDFVVAFYCFHEIRCLDEVISQLKNICKSTTQILLSEQIAHVSKQMFQDFIRRMEIAGFEISDHPHIFLSRTVVMRLKQNK